MGQAGNATADRAIAEAMTWLGTPYRHQGSRRQVGCDCLGLVRGVWRALYGSEPEPVGAYSADWAETDGDDLLAGARRHCIERADGRLVAGHLVIFRWRRALPAKHAGILVDDTRFIHAYQGHGVVISPLVPQWRRRIAGLFAFPPIQQAQDPER